MVNRERQISRDLSHIDHDMFSMQEHDTQMPESDRRATSDVNIGLILSQIEVGVLGNIALCFLSFTKKSLRSTDWILMHSIVVNFLTLPKLGSSCLIRLPPTFWMQRPLISPQSGQENFQCSTRFLHVWQFITVSSQNSKCLELKLKTPKLHCLFCKL